MSMIGKTLAHYEITSQLGKGGMGEVYQAKDRKLGRDVAIKVSPEEFARDTDRVARFQREAKLLASLNHPNIAAIYGLEESGGTNFLVLELVEGDTMADRIKAGPIPVDESLKLALQIAEALEAAHEKGVIHRDLKPANIKVTPEGKVKVLDFGLAKAFAGEQAELNLSNSPTLSNAATQQGVILGTAEYMSPEQARGKPVDKRSDIWSFGVVLFEMFSGKRLFRGETVSDTLAAVLRQDIDWALLPAAMPAALVRTMRRCLQRDPKQRLHDAADVRIGIEEAASTGADTVVGLTRPTTLPWLPIALAVLAGVAIASAFWWIVLRSSREVATPMHLSVALAPETIAAGNSGEKFAISPDGQWISYRVLREGKQHLFLRALRESEGKLLDGTEGADGPFFSPDSQWIGFASGKAMNKVPLSGGPPILICNLPVQGTEFGLFGAAWGLDDRIVFVLTFNAGIWSVPASGGTPELVLKTDEGKDRIAYTDPRVLPGGKAVLFTSLDFHGQPFA